MQYDCQKENESVEPYSRLAYIYDRVMRHVNYAQWARYLSRILKKASQPIHTVLDISCGTAQLTLELQSLGYSLTGFDSAFEMVRHARLNISTTGESLRVWQASMSDYRLRHSVDAVVSTYDSFNYCTSRRDCEGFFRSAADVLQPGGLLIFDVCTLRNSKRYFLDYEEDENLRGVTYRRRSYFTEQENMQHNEFLIKWQDNDTVYREVHRQKIYTLTEIENMISQWSFQIDGVYEGFTMRPGSERSDRVHFVLTRV